MTDLLENPFLIAGLGLMTVILLGSGWIKTGHRGLIYALVAAILVFAGLLIAERRIKTDREQIRELLRQIADDVERNDPQAILGYIHSRADAVRHQASSELPQYEFREIRITRIQEIKVGGQQMAPAATAKFTVRVEGSARQLSGGHFRVIRYVVVDFRKEHNRWKVWAYRHFDFRDALRQAR